MNTRRRASTWAAVCFRVVQERFLVTGGLGCIGAWVAHELTATGAAVVIADPGASDHRVRALLGDATDAIPRVALDITDADAVEAAFLAHRPTHVIHLAALQVLFCKADPALGARVNVVGTVNLLEAAAAHAPGTTFAYASSVAAYGADDEPTVDGRAGADPQGRPRTLYGVFKRANEETAAVYADDRGLASIGLRPFVVYGVGRDQGLTSSPTAAMLAAAAGRPAHIPYGGRCLYHHARDAARAFIAAARRPPAGAAVYNLPGRAASMAELVETIRAVVPDAQVGFDEVQLPFPGEVDAERFPEAVGRLDDLSLADGVAETVARFRDLLARGVVAAP